MTVFAPGWGFAGGVLIGIASVLLMLLLGRIAGVCGIALNVMVDSEPGGRPWRAAFLLGLPLGALLIQWIGIRNLASIQFPAGMPTMLLAGLIVGVGSTIGSGCTSGHGVCGLARWSKRSIAATLTFISTAAATVFIVRHIL
jgi:uncharacterized protein